MSDTSNNKTIAPMTDAMSVPNVPTGIQPISPTNQPPKNPPTIPTMRLIINPEPLPLTIRLASHPATSPISKYQIKYISLWCFVLQSSARNVQKTMAKVLKVKWRSEKMGKIYAAMWLNHIFFTFSVKKVSHCFFLNERVLIFALDFPPSVGEG